jgi:hypothetical protein
VGGRPCGRRTPRLTALVKDRLRRESVGARGLPQESPLARVDDATIQAFQTWYARRAFEGPLPGDLSAEDRAAERAQRTRFDEVAERDRALGLGAVGMLVLAGLAALVLLRRGRKRIGTEAEL